MSGAEQGPPAAGAGRFEIEGQVVDLERETISFGRVTVAGGVILAIERLPSSGAGAPFVVPGLVDSHVHVESSLLVPSQFARLAVPHGTVATVSDPHEIANVLGVSGVEFMIEDGRKVPFKFYFGVPSCVPATAFETAGAAIGPAEVEELFGRHPEIRYLAEMMNYPGVLGGDAEVAAKLAIAKRLGKPVDGHAPGLRGRDAAKYAAAGISTDHECFELDEAREKAALGMKILIREGSAARNFDALIPLLGERPDAVMFCSDDKHPDSLVAGHIDALVRRAVGLGFDPLKVLRAASLNPVRHYSLDVGLLAAGDPADFLVVDDLENFTVRETYIGGQRVARGGASELDPPRAPAPNRFSARPVRAGDLRVAAQSETIKVIEAIDGQLVTRVALERAPIESGEVRADPARDLLKLVVLNRYEPAPPAVAFVRGFGMRCGALASSVAHDSHNIIAVGASDEELARAIGEVVRCSGGLAAACGAELEVLPLPVAGLMSDEDGYAVERAYAGLDGAAKRFGSTLRAPFMTLSFLALLVIPELKLSDRGLFDGRRFEFTPLFP